jgi:hypothetical protein
MARKPNYNFEKRAKEDARKAKKDAKAAERAQRKRDAALGIDTGVAPDDSADETDADDTDDDTAADARAE